MQGYGPDPRTLFWTLSYPPYPLSSSGPSVPSKSWTLPVPSVPSVSSGPSVPSESWTLPVPSPVFPYPLTPLYRYPGATKRTLHFDRWLHFARELYLRNKVEIYFAGTGLMMADFFTKPVDKTKFLECRDYLLTRAE